MSDSESTTTVYEYLNEKVFDSWGIDIQKQLANDGKEGQKLLRLIKTSFVSHVRDIKQVNSKENENYDSWLKENLHIEFANKYRYNLEIKVYYGDGTPGCCASYYFTYTLEKLGECESDAETDTSEISS